MQRFDVRLIAGNIDEDSEWSTVQRGVFPKILSNHHLHRIPAVLVAAYEMAEFGEAYAGQILKNAKALAEAMHDEGFNVCAEWRRGHLEFDGGNGGGLRSDGQWRGAHHAASLHGAGGDSIRADLRPGPL